jgi:hypothetical protein
MLERPFDGRDTLLAQLTTARVRTIDEEGSLRFEGAEQTVHYSNPVTARGVDEDNVPIEMLLLVGKDGRINELDIWKGDGSPIKQKPTASSLEILLGAPGRS